MTGRDATRRSVWPVLAAGLASDERLAKRAAQRDERAFAAIFDRYHQEIYRFCLAMLGNPDDARDALQNTMLKALQALPGEKREIRLRPWLYRVARNESIELLRKRRDAVPADPDLAAPGESLAETAAQRERLRRLLMDIADLPERQRSALVMRELGGLDFEQIADAFETSPAVARQTVYEARLSLRSLEAGREMSCEEVMHRLSNSDGRVRRRRDLQAHLRTCPDCRAFCDGIEARRRDFASLSPLPAIASAGILHSLLGGASGATSGTIGAGGAGVVASAGKAVSAGLLAKSAATVAVVAAVGVSAAHRAGLIHAGLPWNSSGGDPHLEAHGTTTTGASVEPQRESSQRAMAGSGDAPREADNGALGARHGGSHRAASAAAGLGAPPAASRHGHETAATHREGASAGHGHGHGHGAPSSSPPPSRGAQHGVGGNHLGAHGGGSHADPAPANPPPAKSRHEEGHAQPRPEAAPATEHPSTSRGESSEPSTRSEGMP